ncbi:MAG: hypothetical protein M3Z09_11985 [Acidobacteriota bacterium]|nr:hypothetical protein [Acidobacteriota bacterium]
MDLRVYYRKLREVESTLTEPFAVVVSLDTQDGGKAGVCTEVTRHIAAQHIAEARARLATSEESIDFHAGNVQRRRDSEEASTLNRLQVIVVPQKQSHKAAKDS